MWLKHFASTIASTLIITSIKEYLKEYGTRTNTSTGTNEYFQVERSMQRAHAQKMLRLQLAL